MNANPYPFLLEDEVPDKVGKSIDFGGQLFAIDCRSFVSLILFCGALEFERLLSTWQSRELLTITNTTLRLI